MNLIFLVVGLSILTVLLVVIVLLVGFLITPLVKGAWFVPVSHKVASTMIAAAGGMAGKQVMDIGSGDGRLVVAAAKVGARAYGIEINPVLFFLSKIRLRCTKYPGQAKIFFGNLWHQNFCQYDVIFIYGVPHMMQQLEKKLKKELKPDTLVISYIFKFPVWQAHKVHDGKIYVYSV
jgi:2-polyprenyl-3-methyl-5-hydroxy-6-metoxy-1,4-benzoquinol methylase